MAEYRHTDPATWTVTTETKPSEAVLTTLAILDKQLDILWELWRPGPMMIDVPEDEGVKDA